MNQGLDDIERYIKLVDRAVCHHPNAMKMNLMETVIFTLSSPFANEWMSSRWDSRSVDRRGPKHLLIFGDGHNGKTTLFRFMSHILTGRIVEPISGKNLQKKNWERKKAVGDQNPGHLKLDININWPKLPRAKPALVLEWKK